MDKRVIGNSLSWTDRQMDKKQYIMDGETNGQKGNPKQYIMKGWTKNSISWTTDN